MVNRMEAMADALPEEWNEGDPAIDQRVGNLISLEEEWFVDPEVREHFAIIRDATTDDD